MSQARRDPATRSNALSLFPATQPSPIISILVDIFLITEKSWIETNQSGLSAISEERIQVRTFLQRAAPDRGVSVSVLGEVSGALHSALPVLSTSSTIHLQYLLPRHQTNPGHHGPQHQGPASHTEADYSVFQEGWSGGGQSPDEDSQSDVVYGDWYWLHLHLGGELPGHQSYPVSQRTTVSCIRKVSEHKVLEINRARCTNCGYSKF